ncbi:MAG: hypothetical protein CL784_08875 [Chloroflexi bacterium]|nr:hypothetical protein [Chloroflexota bacterium]|tara:strand:+ start:1383 stop:1628 length:246 start_codon:yes stop_codon:yes gene_type:complete
MRSRSGSNATQVAVASAGQNVGVGSSMALAEFASHASDNIKSAANPVMARLLSLISKYLNELGVSELRTTNNYTGVLAIWF